MHDAIVIGSGFGGSVTAAKLTSHGKGVLLLEKGHRWRRPHWNDPAENLHLGAPLSNLVDSRGYPRAAGDEDRWGNPNYVLRQSTDLKYVLFRSPQTGERSGGLMEDYTGDNLSLTVGRGYGGGSLVYSQINLRAPRETFREPEWSALPYSRAILDPYYERVEERLLTYQPSWDAVPRRGAVIADCMARLGITCEPARLGNHRVAGDSDRGLPPVMNPYGREIEPCNGCGLCTFGCIFNAKQVLPLNYLAQAEDTARLDVRTDATAWTIERVTRGYRVHWYDSRDGRFRHNDAKVVVLAAGAINSPELLLRCRDMYGTLPGLSAHVGRHVSGNGDAVFAGLFPDLPGDLKADMFKGHVMSLVSYHWWDRQRFVIEDLGTAPAGVARFPVRREGGDGRYWGPQLKALLRAHYGHDVVGLAGMGIDAPDGRITLDATGRARVAWTKALAPGDRTYELIEAIRAACSSIVAAGGGELLHEKEWSDNRRLLSVHPVGGNRMATSISQGVVDPQGMVFGYPGLFVMDGSILPAAIGVNPALTIASIAEKTSDDLVAYLVSL
jgi:cholesterol oxidase